MAAPQQTMIKALFLDLDGTLLTSDRQISPATADALARCRANGLRLFVATARPPLLERMLSLAPGQLALFEGGAYYNGGLIRTPLLESYTLLPRAFVAESVATVLDYPGYNLALQMTGERHAFRYPLEPAYLPLWGLTPGLVLDLAAADYSAVVKMVIFSAGLVDASDALPVDLAARLAAIPGLDANLVVTDDRRVIQVTAAQANKRLAVERICRAYRIAHDEAAVFGDDAPDLGMLAAFTNSVAMGNASPAVKAAARYVTRDNDHDGIAYALREFLGVL